LRARSQPSVSLPEDGTDLVRQLRAGAEALTPDQIHACVTDALMTLGYVAANLAVLAGPDLVRASHTRGSFASFDGAEARLTATLTELAVESGELVFLPDYQLSEWFVPGFRQSEVRTTLSMVVSADGRPCAVLHGGWPMVRPTSEVDRDVFRRLALLAGEAFGRAAPAREQVQPRPVA
jgi:hypothetical protein